MNLQFVHLSKNMPTEHQLLESFWHTENSAEGGLITSQTSLAYDF